MFQNKEGTMKKLVMICVIAEMLLAVSSSAFAEQIDWIIAQQDLYTTGLVDSYEDDGNDWAWIYDQALAIIAFNCVTDPIAWMVIAINYYESQTADESYASMAANALGWLDTMRNTDPADQRYGSLRFSTYNPSPNLISTEHNIDAYSAYYWRGMLDSNNSYIDKANLVLDYLRTKMWDLSLKIFWRGWNDPIRCTDPQSWGVLSLGPVGPDGEDFVASLDWLWSADGNTRTEQDYNEIVLDVQGFKSCNDEVIDYIWVEATDGVASAYYSVGDNVRGELFHSQMARTVAVNGGLVHSFSEFNSHVYWDPGNLRYNHLASVAWHYFNKVTPKINPFCINLPVRINGTHPVYYSTLQAAYNAAQDGDVIQSHAVMFMENLDLNDRTNKSITMKGGYNCGYTGINGFTHVKGSISVINGSNIVENFILKN
jgi:hypothetical protein